MNKAYKTNENYTIITDNYDEILIKINKIDMDDILFTIIQEFKINKPDMVKQGFINEDEIENLYSTDLILTSFYDFFIELLIKENSFSSILKNIFRQIEKMYKVKENNRFLSMIVNKIKAKMRSFYIENLTNINGVSYQNLTFFDMLYIPKNVKFIYLYERPTTSIISLLRAIKMPFYIDEHKDDLMSYLGTTEPKINTLTEEKTRHHRLENFELGVNINRFKDLNNVLNFEPNHIIIEPEIDYLFNSGLSKKSDRILFYEELKSKFEGIKTFITLPRLDLLYNYHGLNSDYTLHSEVFMKHYFMYITELEAYLSVYGAESNILVPQLTEAKEFSIIKKLINCWTLRAYKIKAKIGINIETDSAFDYSEEYKKFDFVLIDMDRLYGEIFDNSTVKSFVKDLSYVGQLLKIRKKEVYLIGTMINSSKHFKKLITRGFKKYCIHSYDYLDRVDAITNYLNTRGTHKKPII